MIMMTVCFRGTKLRKSFLCVVVEAYVLQGRVLSPSCYLQHMMPCWDIVNLSDSGQNSAVQCSGIRYPGDSYVGDEEDGGCEALGQHILDSDLQQEGYQHLIVNQFE